MPNPIIPYDPQLRQFARELRNNPTSQEELLWKKIRKRKLGAQFHRQVPMDHFIVDFYCHEIMLAIEVDGRYHDYQILEDSSRQARIEKYGVTVIRFTNDEIEKEMEMVLDSIRKEVELRLE